MGKKKKILNLDKPGQGPTRRLVQFSNTNIYRHSEPESPDYPCIPESISSEVSIKPKNSSPRSENKILDTEERALNESDNDSDNEGKDLSNKENSIPNKSLEAPKETSKLTKNSDKSKLVNMNVSDVRPNSLHYSNNLLKSEVPDMPKQAQLVNSESVSPTLKDKKSDLLVHLRKHFQNPYLHRAETPKLNDGTTIASQNKSSESNSKDENRAPPPTTLRKERKRVKSYLMFGRPSSELDKMKLSDNIRPNYDIGEHKTLYHEDGYLWGQSRFHFSNFRIHVYFWTYILTISGFLLLIYCYKKFYFWTKVVIYSVLGLFIFRNFFFMVDFYYLVKYRGCSVIPGITLILNLVYWITQVYGYFFGYQEVWIVGLLLLIVDLVLCCYFHSSKTFRIHRTFNGVVESTLSVIRFFLMGKATKAFHIYWTVALFPLTGFSIFSTFLFVFLLMQEIMILVRRKKNNHEHAGKIFNPISFKL